MTNASVAADPACQELLAVIGQGRALTPREWARESGLPKSVVETHLEALEASDVVRLRWQGPHRYFAAARTADAPPPRVTTGPRDPAMRRARVCYGHLGGDIAVRMFDRLAARDLITVSDDAVRLTAAGTTFVDGIGVDRKLGKPCLDWSNRRSHLAGPLGNAFLKRFYELGWAVRDPDSRLVSFSPSGEQGFDGLFG